MNLGSLTCRTCAYYCAVGSFPSKNITSHALSFHVLNLPEEVEKMSKKMEEVKEAQVRVVSEEFLQDIKSSSKSFEELLSLHALSPWGTEVKQDHKEVSMGGKSSGHSHTKSTGKNKEEQGEKNIRRASLLEDLVFSITLKNIWYTGRSQRVLLYLSH